MRVHNSNQIGVPDLNTLSLDSSAILFPSAKDDGVDLFWQRPHSGFHRCFGSPEDEWVTVNGKDGPPISPEEAESLCDLLSKIMMYEPEKLISAEELTKHPWFATDFDDEDISMWAEIKTTANAGGC